MMPRYSPGCALLWAHFFSFLVNTKSLEHSSPLVAVFNLGSTDFLRMGYTRLWSLCSEASSCLTERASPFWSHTGNLRLA